MKLSSFLFENSIFWNVELNSLDEIYQTVGKSFSKLSSIETPVIIDSLLERDKLGFTLLGNGFALPHGRLDNFNDLLIGIVKLRAPIELNNTKTDFFFVLLTSKTGSNIYLKALAAIAKLIKNHGEEIKKLKSTKEMLDFVNSNNITLTDPLKASDIMNSEVPVLNIGMSVEEIVNIMKKSGFLFFPIVDQQGKYAGKIDILDILRISFPDYLFNLTDFSFLTNFRAFEEFEINEKKYKVKDLFQPDPEKLKTVNKKTTIIECAFLLIKHHWHHLTVIDDGGSVVGVISSEELLQKILRA